MSFFAFIGAAISVVASVIGPALSAAATYIAAKLPTVLMACEVVGSISAIMINISRNLDIAPDDERPDELGAKVMQEDTRPIMPTETTQEYLDYLRNEVELDREKYEKMTTEQKVNCEIVGDTMLAKSIEEKTGVGLPPEFLVAAGRINLDYKTVNELINSFSSNGINSLGDYQKYISNNMSEKDAVKVGSAVREAISYSNPEMTQEDIEAEIVAMKQGYNTEK